MRRDNRAFLAVLTLSLLALPAFAQQPAADAPPCSTEEYRLFDFWIGEWEVVDGEGNVLGRNTIESILGGCAITESWTGSQGSTGRSVNMFFKRDGKWHQTWVDNSGGRLDLVGGLEKDSMTLSGTMPGADGNPVLHEISWTPQPDGTVIQSWRASKNRGRDWQQLFHGIYRPAGSS